MHRMQWLAAGMAWGILCLAVTCAQAGWVAVGSADVAPPTIQTLDPAPQHVVLTYRLPGFFAEPVQIDGQPFTQITLPGQPPLLEKGYPQLAALARSVIIPDQGTPVLRILESKYLEVPLDPVEPSKGSLPRTIDPATVPYDFASFYTDGGVYPAREVELSDPYIVRDHRGVTVRVYPLRYDATRRILLALQSLTVEIATTGTGGVNVKQRILRAGTDPQFTAIYRNYFLNGRADTKYDPVLEPGPMLVVCYDAFAGPISPFVEWKRQKGFDVELITTSEVGGTAAGIQTAIEARYFSADGLTYVVLVGDIAQVPTRLGSYEGADSDPTYAMVEGDDYYPDLFISRLSAQNAAQVELQVTKFVRYERDPDLDGDWYHMGTGIASNEGSPSDSERCDWLRQDLLSYTFTHVDQIYQGQGGSTAMITAALNEGRSLVNYLGHGSGSAWTSVYYGIGEVHALDNGWAHPWILDVSCSNGDFSQNECFAEAWLRAGTVAQPTGAVGIYSASTLAAWVPPTVMQAHAVDLLVAEEAASLGALYFFGAMQTLDTYPPPNTAGIKLVEQYNIFGDCSLVVRTDTPAIMPVSHLPIVPLGTPSYTVDVPGQAGATVCLYRDGIVHGTAVTDETGHAEIFMSEPVVTPGEITLTVTAYNRAPYIATLMAVVPAVITIDPPAIPVGTMTPVTVTVTDTLGTGISDVTVWITGFGIETLEQVTDGAGQATFDVTPLYGENLVVRGREHAETFDLFTEALPVTDAPPLTAVTFTAEARDVGLNGALAPGFPGTVTARAFENELRLFLNGCGVDSSASNPNSAVVMTVTPTSTGTLTATLAKDGYALASQAIPVIIANGALAGGVFEEDGTTPIGGARVYGYPAAADTSVTLPLFDLLTDLAGAYAVPDSLPVGDYDLYVTKFGYLAAARQVFLRFGGNVADFALAVAPSGVLSGAISSADGGAPLAATIKVYRSDNGELFAETVSDTANGHYTTPALPFFSYSVTVKAWHYIPVTITVDIDQPSVIKDFALEPTVGDILVVDDSSKAAGQREAKLDKGGVVLAEAYTTEPSRSALLMASELEDLGYAVSVEDVGATDPGTWDDHDLLIVATGGSTTPVDNATFRTQIENFVDAGGHLLIEGGEVAYRAAAYPGFPSFAANVLHVDDWNHDSSGSVTVAAAGHAIWNVPNLITGPIAVSYSGYGDQDAVTVAADAQLVGSWSSYPTDGSVVAYDSNPAPAGGQIVFFTFNYAAMEPTARQLLVQNAATYLMAIEVGNSSVSGQVILQGQADHSGVLVELAPGGESFVTESDGIFSFPGLFAGTYQIIASKEGWATAVTDFTLAEGEDLTGVELLLAPMTIETYCRAPALPIPDVQAVDDTLVVDLDAAVSGIEVFVDITHTYIGDLVVELISPEGTTVRLHNRTGGSADDIYGWYPSELTPYGNLANFLGEQAGGMWVLHVSDHAGSDTGTLNEWCLRLTVPQVIAGSDDRDEVPQVLTLEDNYPNPFNPKTQIVFALPQAAEVDLAVYDVRGRRLATLIHQGLTPGHHTVAWYGTDDTGRQVSSGIYFYRLVADGQTLTGKMTLLK